MKIKKVAVIAVPSALALVAIITVLIKTGMGTRILFVLAGFFFCLVFFGLIAIFGWFSYGIKGWLKLFPIVGIIAMTGGGIIGWNFLSKSQPPPSVIQPEKKEVFQEARPESEKAAKKLQLPPRKEEAGPTFIKIRPGEVIDLSQ